MDALRWNDRLFCLELLDQRLLPQEITYISCETARQVADAITDMVVRGAPAIGVAAAYGMVIATKEANSVNNFRETLAKKAKHLKQARPTAVNLSWAVEKMLDLALAVSREEAVDILLSKAKEIQASDVAICKAIGRHGQVLINKDDGVLTHCNAGALATAGYGTALGVIRSAVEHKKNLTVYAGETRPYMQGARLTASELLHDGIKTILICDSAAGFLMQQGKVDKIIVGADRIAANGDTANKIGTYSLAVLAKAHSIPFLVAAPLSSIDMSIKTGKDIPVEMRGKDEITHIRGIQVAPDGIDAMNPAFDVTPHDLIHGIITEKGIAYSPFFECFTKFFEN